MVDKPVASHVSESIWGVVVVQHCCKLFVSVGTHCDVFQRLEAVHLCTHPIENSGYVGGNPLFVVRLFTALAVVRYVLGAGHAVGAHQTLPVTREIQPQTSATRGAVPVWADVELDATGNYVVNLGSLCPTFKTLVVLAAHVILVAAYQRDVLAVRASPDLVPLDVLATTHCAFYGAHVVNRVTHFDLTIDDGLDFTVTGKCLEGALPFPEAVVEQRHNVLLGWCAHVLEHAVTLQAANPEDGIPGTLAQMHGVVPVTEAVLDFAIGAHLQPVAVVWGELAFLQPTKG